MQQLSEQVAAVTVIENRSDESESYDGTNAGMAGGNATMDAAMLYAPSERRRVAGDLRSQEDYSYSCRRSVSMVRRLLKEACARDHSHCWIWTGCENSEMLSAPAHRSSNATRNDLLVHGEYLLGQA